MPVAMAVFEKKPNLSRERNPQTLMISKRLDAERKGGAGDGGGQHRSNLSNA
jgi:hypothetical protein